MTEQYIALLDTLLRQSVHGLKQRVHGKRDNSLRSKQTHVCGKWSLVVVGTALRNQRYKSTWGHLSHNDVYTLSVSTIYIVNVVFF